MSVEIVEDTLTRLMEALDEEKDVKEIEEILKGSSINNNLNINLPFGESNETPLHRIYNKKLVKLFVEYGADINSKDDSGMTPLMKALFLEKEIDIIEELLEYGADVNCVDKMGNVPLHSAYSVEVIDLLISFGASIDIANDEDVTPLLKAILEGKDLSVINCFLWYGANPNTKSKTKVASGPIHHARTEELVKCLVWYGVDFVSTIHDIECTLKGLLVKYRCLIKKSDHSVQSAKQLLGTIQQLLKYSIVIIGKGFYRHFIFLLTSGNSRQRFKGMLTDDVMFLHNLKTEYDEMVKYEITKTLTLRDFFVSYLSNYLLPINDSNLRLFIYDDNESSLKEKFPLYYEVIIMNKIMFRNRISLLNKLSKLEISSQINKQSDCNEEKIVHLPYDCVRLIGDYLTYRDLVNLFVSSFELRKPKYVLS